MKAFKPSNTESVHNPPTRTESVRQKWLEPQTPTDLERIEGLLHQLAFEMQTIRVTAARVIRALDTDRRDALREQRDSEFTAKILVGAEREKQIQRLIARAGWSLREVVDRKLPLTRLPPELKVPLREGRLEPTRALLLNRSENSLERAKLLSSGASTRTIQAAIPKRKKITRAASLKKPDPQIKSDFRMIERAATRQLGYRVTIDVKGIRIDCGLEGLNDMLKRLRIEL